MSAWPPQKWGGFFVGAVLEFVDFADVADVVACFLAVFCDFLIFFLTKLQLGIYYKL